MSYKLDLVHISDNILKGIKVTTKTALTSLAYYEMGSNMTLSVVYNHIHIANFSSSINSIISLINKLDLFKIFQMVKIEAVPLLI